MKNSKKLVSVDVIRLGVSVSPEMWKSRVCPPTEQGDRRPLLLD